MFLRGAVSLAITMAVLAFSLFLPAGRVGWIKAWIFLAVFLVLMVVSSVYLWRTNPELIAARSKFHRGTKGWDKVVFFFLELAFISICWVAGFDDGRFHWSAVPLWLIGAGYAFSTVGFATIVWAMSVNKFAEITVRIQTERGHKVVDTGPYAIVRHPFYVVRVSVDRRHSFVARILLGSDSRGDHRAGSRRANCTGGPNTSKRIARLQGIRGEGSLPVGSRRVVMLSAWPNVASEVSGKALMAR